MSKTLIERSVVEQALNALDAGVKISPNSVLHDRLRAALEQRQVEQEPFCYVNVNKQGDVTSVIKRKDSWRKTPLYLHPQLSQHTAVTECVAAIRTRS